MFDLENILLYNKSVINYFDKGILNDRGKEKTTEARRP